MILELLNEEAVVLEMDYNQDLRTPVGVAPEYAPPSCGGLDGFIAPFALTNDDFERWV